VLGILERADETSFAVRTRAGNLVAIPVAQGPAAKVVPAAAARSLGTLSGGPVISDEDRARRVHERAQGDAAQQPGREFAATRAAQHD
jgi:antitoxin (DNA-binding transcriptional repressor) of toxin-antitoxin stability system